MAELLSTIDPNDGEHPDVALTHETEWCLAVFASGLVVFENLEQGDPRHMRLPKPIDALPLWQQLARGDIKGLNALAWVAGYGQGVGR